MKVLFLDVDGVLNTSKSKSIFALGKGHLKLLKSIVEDTDCKIVLSSAWRIIPDAKRHLINKLAYRDMQIYSSTENIPRGIRGDEICEWLYRHPEVTKYAIVDDNSDMLVEQLPHFFQTDMDFGLTKTITYRIVYHLNE